jgi:ATP-dependent helicase/nuclease subunit A
MKKIISYNAGAGAGKTTKICDIIYNLCKDGTVCPERFIATSFTKKAANELKERIRLKFLKEGEFAQAEKVELSYINTVHGVCAAFLKRYAFEAGISPEVEILDESEAEFLFSNAFAEVLDDKRAEQLEILVEKLEIGEDWRKTINNIVELAFANKIDPSNLKISIEKNLKDYKEFFEIRTDYKMPVSEKVVALMNEVVSSMNKEDRNVKANGYLSEVKRFRAILRNNKFLTWKQWFDLSEITPGPQFLRNRPQINALVEELQEIAEKHKHCADFWQDISNYTHHIYSLASESMEKYNSYKSSRCLIDFNDQEVLFLNLLNKNPEVCYDIKKAFDLLIVDEFQDTNPIQLSIFLKISELVNQTIWVGDPKQAIYGFRDTDPELMLKVVGSSLVEEGVRLDQSYRSVRDIVGVVNSFFTEAFDAPLKDTVPLKVTREENLKNSINRWHFKYTDYRKRGNTNFFPAFAYKLDEFLKEGHQIFDKKTKQFRDLMPGDIAILGRYNGSCLQFTKYLNAQGIKTSFSEAGLSATAESLLLKACLRKLLNAGDTLATAELLFLTDKNPNLGKLIENRLDFLYEKKSDSSWGEENVLIQGIEKIRENLHSLTPSLIVARLVEDLDLKRIVKCWGNELQRVANLDKMKSFAREFEDFCIRLNVATTLKGFILWLDKIAGTKKDSMATSSGPEAVNILTYHGSKGLEWPLVILYDLNSDLKVNMNQPFIVDESENSSGLNSDALLAGRRVRYWPYPYGKKDSWLSVGINQSDAFHSKRVKELNEAKRLLYVGFTRARDYLVFATRQMVNNNDSNIKWLDNANPNGNEINFPKEPESKEYETTWNYDGITIKMKTSVIIYPDENIDMADKLIYQVLDYPEASGRVEGLKLLKINPSKINLSQEEIPKYDPSKVINFRERIKPGKIEDEELGDVVHWIYAVYNKSESTDWNILKAEKIINDAGYMDIINPKEVVKSAENLVAFLDKMFPGATYFKELPVQMLKEGQIYSGTADLVLETEDGLILIDHKSFQGGENTWEKKYIENYGQLLAYKEMLEKSFEKPVIKAFIHFPIAGGLVELSFGEVAGEGDKLLHAVVPK